MNPLSPRARDILDRYRAHESLSGHDKKHLLDVIRQRAARGDLPRFDVQTPLPAGPKSSSWMRFWSASFGKLAMAVIVAAPVLVVVGARRNAAASRPPHSDAVGATGESIEAALAAPGVPLPVPSSSSLSGGGSSRRRAPTRTVKPADAPVTDSSPTIDAEMRLLNAAQSSIRSGTPVDAIRLLEEHASRFPSSKLADAREVAHMVVLCRLGQVSLAREEVDRFLARRPGSAFAERVANVCVTQAVR